MIEAAEKLLHPDVECDKRFDRLAIYSQLLGLPERRYPRDFAEFSAHVFLPGDLVTSMGDMVMESEKAYKEKEQIIDWDRSSQKYIAGIPTTGNDHFVPVPKEQWDSIYFGKKALFEYHVHPRVHFFNAHGILFSPDDMALFYSYPRYSYIHAVMTSCGGSFVFQTQRASKLPFSSEYRYRHIRRMIKDPDVDFLVHGHRWKQLGYGLYLWFPKEVIENRNPMSEGISLTRYDLVRYR